MTAPRPILRALAGLLVPFAIGACRKSPASTENAAPVRATAHDVEFPRESPQLGSIQVTEATPVRQSEFRFTGRLTWNEDFTNRVFSPIAGRVEKVVAEIGQHLNPGDDLALLRSPEFGQAQADYRKAAGDFAQTDKTLTRVKALREHGAAAQKDLDSAQADFLRASAEKQRAAARLQLLGALEGDFSDVYHLATPIEGIVVDRNLNVGQEIRSDMILASTPQLTAPLFTITNPTRLWVVLDVPENDLNKLKLKQPVEVRTPAYPARVFTGQVDVIGAFLDPLTRVARVRASIDNAESFLKAEMYVNVRVTEVAESTTDVEVPSRSVIYLDGKYFVFVEAAPRKFERREVTVEREGGGETPIVVVRGLSAGQRIVSHGNLLINELLLEDNETAENKAPVGAAAAVTPRPL